MLRSMDDPFELNAAFLCDLIREKAKEQSPPALLFCIRINHFPLLCPERSGGHFKSFLLGSVELCLDLCRGCRGNKAHHNTDHQRHQEGRQQLVDAKHAAQRADDVLPYKDHQAAGEHTGQHRRRDGQERLACKGNDRTDRRAERAEAQLVCSYLDPDDRVFYVGQGDNGEGWFSAVFDFYPILVDYSGTVTTDPDTGETKMIGGGGELGLPELQPAEGVKNTYYHGFTAQELDSIVRGNGCTVLYIQTLDDIFVQSYADLFTDKLAAAQSGETLLYRVTDAGFAPMPMEVSAQ